MSFGGQTPTIIVLKEGERYPTARLPHKTTHNQGAYGRYHDVCPCAGRAATLADQHD